MSYQKYEDLPPLTDEEFEQLLAENFRGQLIPTHGFPAWDEETVAALMRTIEVLRRRENR